ncbi:MAG: rhombosortase [Gammaproteobacteria bacterium]|nr:rhombosortase [Gammaproteobacteria bacterium]
MRIQVPIKNRISARANYILWLFLFVICFSLQSANMASVMQYDRGLIEQGQYWLLMTGHLVHLNWVHWALNMAGLMIVAVFFSLYGSIVDWLFVLLFSALITGLGLYWLHPELIWYVGLSGVLHGLFVYGAILETRFYPISGYLLLLLISAKLFWEYMNGPLPGSEAMTGGRVMVEAHLYGAIAGLVAVFITWSLHLFHQLVEVKNGQQNAQNDQQDQNPHR